MPKRPNSPITRKIATEATPIVSKGALANVGSQGGALSQQQGKDVIAGLSDEDFQRLLAIQTSPAQRNVLLRGRPDSPPSVSRIQQAPPRTTTQTPGQAQAQRKTQAGFDDAARASVEQSIADVKVQNLKRVAEGKQPLRVPEPFKPRPQGVPGDARISGIPVADNPALFQQDFTGVRSPTQERPLPFGVSAPPVPGLPGSVEAITGADMQAILAEAGIPFHSAADNPGVAFTRNDDPFAGFFTPDRTVELTASAGPIPFAFASRADTALGRATQKAFRGRN